MEDEVIASLHEIRSSWIKLQTTVVVHGLLMPCEDTTPYSVLAPWVANDGLTLAAALTSIASDDALARAPHAIAESLRATGLARPDASADEVARCLVSPVVRRVRRDGVPWQRWWDVHGLLYLLIELWTARRLAAAPPEIVRRELRAVWRVENEHVPTVLANAVNPFVLLPPDLFETSLTGEATQLLRGLIAAAKLQLRFDDDLNGYLPDLGDRDDLKEVVRRVRVRDDLEHAVRKYVQGMGPRETERFRADLASWDDQLGRFLPTLTAYEVELCCKPRPGTAYRDQCLTAGRNNWVYPLLEEDALPAQAEPGEPSKPAPSWMQDEIISGGARAFRTNVGPYPVWLLAAETSLGQVAVEALRIPGQSYGLGHRVGTDGVEIRLRLPVPDGDPGPAPEVPFFYSLSYVNSAWQLLHLAAVGHVRLVILTLAQEDALRTRGSTLISLSDEMRDDLTDHALTALRSLVGDDMKALLIRRGIDEPEAIASATFHANEAAKGEELLDEIIREPPAGAEPQRWAAFQEASRTLARARALMAAAIANHRSAPELAAAVDQAVENRQRAREMARASSGTLDHRAWEHGLATALPDDRTAFIHFFFKNDILQSIYLVRDQDHPDFSPVRSSPITMNPLLTAVRNWAAKDTSLGWHQALQALLADFMEEVLQPLAEELHARGLTRLIISPTPPLDLLPLHAVSVTIDGVKHALCEVFDELTYVPTVRMLAAISDRPVSASASPLIVAHCGGVLDFPRIDGPALEAANLRALYPDAKILTGHDATPDTVLAAMTGARLVHIASHARTTSDRWASGLVLQGEIISQALLSAADIHADGDLSGVELVVLNACRTGSHRSAARVVQTLRGLEATFLARGAHAVISTLWEVNDLTALAFATLLHASMAQGDPPAKAYRKAIGYLRSEGWREPTCLEDSIHHAETLLDWARPTWRGELDRQVKGNPLSWSGYKITGLI